MTSRAQGGWLADDLYLLAHDDVRGKPRLHPRIAGVALAGALLAELVLAGRIAIHPNSVDVVDARPVPNALATQVLTLLLGEARPHPVGTWLTFFAPDSTAWVAERLGASGVLTLVRSRLGRAPRWVPTDMPTAAAPSVLLHAGLTAGRALTLSDVTLAGLATACGLIQQVLWDAPPQSRDYLVHLLSRLPEPLRLLIAETEAAMGAAVMNRHL
jgi:Golgi phosphoprotein 3 (GPP34)